MNVYVLMSDGLDEAKEQVCQVEGVYGNFEHAKATATVLEKKSKLLNPPSYSIQTRELGMEDVITVHLRHPDGSWDLCWPLGA